MPKDDYKTFCAHMDFQHGKEGKAIMIGPIEVGGGNECLYKNESFVNVKKDKHLTVLQSGKINWQ